MDQSTITNFFSKRKRPTTVGINKQHAKVLVLEHELTPRPRHKDLDGPGPSTSVNHSEEEKGECEEHSLHKTFVYNPKQFSNTKRVCKYKSTTKDSSQKDASQRNGNSNSRKTVENNRPRTQPDIRKTFLNVKQSVRFELKGNLSPKKKKIAEEELTGIVKTVGCPLSPRRRPSPTSHLGLGLPFPGLRQDVQPATVSIETEPINIDLIDTRPMVCLDDALASETVLLPVETKVMPRPSPKNEPKHYPSSRPSGSHTEQVIANMSDICNLAPNLLGLPVIKSKQDTPRVRTGDFEEEVRDEATLNARKDLGLMTPKRIGDSRKELSLNEIKATLSRSAKLAQLRESLAKINKGKEKLKEIEHEKQFKFKPPKLGAFKTIVVEVKSPRKDVLHSPQKSSPVGSPAKSAVYQRIPSLTATGAFSLTLPTKHRCLAEVFRCVDTIVAMMHNRKEVITFKKLKPAVQLMLRRNVMESHLGQIKQVFPMAFSFHQEKQRSFAHMSKPDEYELTITPLIDTLIANEDGKHSESLPMTPSCLVTRRQTFAANLMNRVMSDHEKFLQSLDPPLSIPREKLTHWHPDFDLNTVPEIEPEGLPQPPNIAHYSTAKDVLAKAKTLFSCNERMEKALERVSQMSMKNELGENVHATTSEPSSPMLAALKGLPKTLLDKVRANQAARAMLVMSRTPAEEKRQIQFSRLPELARIVRNIYVGEKKKVIPLEFAIEKLGNSYRENLSPAELDEHLRLLLKSVPGWLVIENVRNKEFLKLSINADVALVMNKLEKLATERK